jgi:hypothetical protein
MRRANHPQRAAFRSERRPYAHDRPDCHRDADRDADRHADPDPDPDPDPDAQVRSYRQHA